MVGVTLGVGIGVGIGVGKILANLLIIRLGVRGVTKMQSCLYTRAREEAFQGVRKPKR